MNKSQLILRSLVSTVGVALYIFSVVWLINNINDIFKDSQNFLIPVVMLLLFVLSATVTGILVLGQPLYLYFNDAKNDAVRLFLYTLVFLFITTSVILITLLKY